MSLKGSFSRRNFLKSTAVAVGACAFSRVGFAADTRFGGLPIGVQSYSLRNFDLEQAMRHIQGLGLHHVEFYGKHFPLDSSDEQIQRMKALLASAEVAVTAHGVNGFSKDHDANRRIFDFAKRAGIRNLTADPAPDSFGSLERLVDEYNIRICIHNHGPGARYDKLESVASALEGRHDAIGVCIDTGHVLRSDEDPVEWARELKGRVFALHIKDVAEKQKKTHDVIVGSAHLNLVSLFDTLKRTGFPHDGSMSLEYESSPDNPIDDIRQCLDAVDKAIADVNAR